MRGAARIVSPRLRRERIADLVRRKGAVTVDDLVRRFNTSAETIRRDLTALADDGTVRKVHGGATLPRAHGEGPFRERMVRNAVEKRVIAEKMQGLVAPGETLFIDTGSTTVMCAEALSGIRGLTVITNSTRIAAIFGEGAGDAAVYLLGGRFDADNQETVGAMVLDGIRNFHADHAVITLGALDAGAGGTDFNADEADVARAMIDHADDVIVLADSSKWETSAPFRVCSLERIGTLVSDAAPGGALAQALSAARVAVC